MNTAAVVEPRASARMALEVSFSVASLSNPAMVILEVFPMVSSPDVTNDQTNEDGGILDQSFARMLSDRKQTLHIVP